VLIELAQTGLPLIAGTGDLPILLGGHALLWIVRLCDITALNKLYAPLRQIH
jgi:hypothetical protein